MSQGNVRRGAIATCVGLAVAGATIAFPGSASAAAVNTDGVRMHSIPYIGASFIIVGATRYAGNPEDPMHVTATEAADGKSVTIKSSGPAAGGFVVANPCTKVAIDTAICPTMFNGLPVKQVMVLNPSAGNNVITMDVPTFSAHVSLGNGDDTVRILRSTSVGTIGANSTMIDLSGGNDKFYGGSGEEIVYAGAGVDQIDVFNSPSSRDRVGCGDGTGEPPLDTVIVDSADVMLNSNCLAVVHGP